MLGHASRTTRFYCPQELTGVRLDGAVAFFWHERLFVIARKHLAGPEIRKRTALYEITGNLEGGPIGIVERGELPSAGDTSYAGVAPIGGARFLATWYSSPPAEDPSWLVGHLRPTRHLEGDARPVTRATMSTWSRSVAVSLAAAALLATTAQPAGAAGRGALVDLSRSELAARVSDRYVSFGVDLDQVTGGEFWSPVPGEDGNVPVPPYDFTRRRLRLLTRELSPAYLRISGTAANKTFYDLSDDPVTTPPAPFLRILTRHQWDAVNAFARTFRLRVILGINAGPGPRDAAGAWTPGNARELLEYTAQRAYPLPVVEFGNEPNLFSLVSGMPASYSAADYVRDLRSFEALRKAVVPGARLMGPGNMVSGTGSETPWLDTPFGPLARDVLPSAGRFYDIITYHHYPAFSDRCPPVGPILPKDRLRRSFLEGAARSFAAVRSLRDRYAAGRPIWLGEAASAGCGGQRGYSNRFEATFWYLNALGSLAERGMKVFVRQTLSGSDYGLIDDVTLKPNPDYWAALLWRRLMGTRVLRPHLTRAPRTLIAFASCRRRGPGATLVALNVDRRRSRTLRLRGAGGLAEVYRVTAPSVSAERVRLNGRPLRTGHSGRVPRLRPQLADVGSLRLPPLSYTFATLPGATIDACRS